MSVTTEYEQFRRLTAEVFRERRTAWCEGFLVGLAVGLPFGWLIL